MVYFFSKNHSPSPRSSILRGLFFTFSLTPTSAPSSPKSKFLSLGWSDGTKPVEGSWRSSGTENEGDWPFGVYVFGISGSGAETQYVRVTLTPYPEQSLPARKYDQSGVTLVGGAFYHVISQMVGDGSSWTDNKKVRKENMTYRFTDWWYPYLSNLKSGFDGQVDDQNNAKHVAEVLEQKVRSYTELHRADFETIFRQPDGTIAAGKPYTAEELKTTIYYSAGRINGMATIEWGPAFKSGPRLYWGGNTYETTWHDWPVTKFSVWRD